MSSTIDKNWDGLRNDVLIFNFSRFFITISHEVRIYFCTVLAVILKVAQTKVAKYLAASLANAKLTNIDFLMELKFVGMEINVHNVR